MDKAEELCNLIKADTRLIQIVSYETLRIHGFLANASDELNREFYAWNAVEGIRKWEWNEDKSGSLKENKEFDEDNKDPLCVLNLYLSFFKDKEKKNKGIIFLLEDFHPHLCTENLAIIRILRNIALISGQKKTLVLSQPFLHLPRELEKEMHVFELPYPDSEDIIAIYKEVCGKYNIKDSDNPDPDLISAALGLTIMEAEKAFSLAYIEGKKLGKDEAKLVIREKENVIKKSGHLEYYSPKEEMENIGGLDRLKNWLKKRRHGFDKGAEDFFGGPAYPRGILLLGIPGTGKSLTAKAIGNLWHFPLLRLDMGKIFAGTVGESEKNIREALNIAEAIAPSILWIDEIEKGMSGISSSGSTDGGTTARVLGTFLTWMQEKSKPVFVVATANDISLLPPELLRKGRVDEIFFVDLPTKEERKEIFEIHLNRRKREPKDFDIEKIADASKGFSGAELEEVLKEALFQSYDNKQDLDEALILKAIKDTYPLARTMKETIYEMRKWAKKRAVLASFNENIEKLDFKGDEEIPKLPQEMRINPFAKKKEG
jgi:hypothetical protein